LKKNFIKRELKTLIWRGESNQANVTEIEMCREIIVSRLGIKARWNEIMK
jgi:hypothetical protein